MTCYACGHKGKLKKGTIASYRYDEAGLDNVYLLKVPSLKCSKCGAETPEIFASQHLHELLGDAIVSKKYLLSAREVRYLRTLLGYSQKDFAEVIHRDPSVLNRVERGKDNVSEDLDRVVRMVYLKEHATPKRLYEEVENLISDKTPKNQAYRIKATRQHTWSLLPAQAA